MEWLVHRNMALCSNLLSFAYSKWTTEIEDVSKIVLNYQLHTTDSEPNQVTFRIKKKSKNSILLEYFIKGPL